MDLYRAVARYMNTMHPYVPYHFDLAGVHNPSRTTRGIYKALNGRAWPDLFIAKSVFTAESVDVMAGLFIELKAAGTRLKKRDGEWASEHIKEQAQVLSELIDQGFVATFAVGLDEAIEIIDSYLGGGEW